MGYKFLKRDKKPDEKKKKLRPACHVPDVGRKCCSREPFASYGIEGHSVRVKVDFDR